MKQAFKKIAKVLAVEVATTSALACVVLSPIIYWDVFGAQTTLKKIYTDVVAFNERGKVAKQIYDRILKQRANPSTDTDWQQQVTPPMMNVG